MLFGADQVLGRECSQCTAEGQEAATSSVTRSRQRGSGALSPVKSRLSTLRSTPKKDRLARLVAFDWETLERYRHASDQGTDPDDTDVPQPGHEAAGVQDSEVDHVMLEGR